MNDNDFSHIGAFVAIAKLLEPVFASILGLFIFTEVPSHTSCLGGILIIAGITIYSLKKN